MPDTVKNYVMLGLAVLVTVFGLAAFEYKRMYKATDFALKTQSEAIDRQNREAADRLKRMTAARDTLQSQINALEETRKTEKKEFDDALKSATGQPAAPVRVRVQACPAGPGGGGAAGDKAADGPGRGSAPETSVRLLPEANTRRLELALNAVELLSRDFNSAKDQLESCLKE